jgi:F-type H+-transporting ATPase subunit gamma
MPSVRQIRRRIRSVQNTAKITKAMQMIAASKMRRAQDRVFASRPYAEKMMEVLSHLSGGEGEAVHPLLERRDAQNITLVHITPDRGLTGGLIGNLNRRASQFLLENETPTGVVTVGKRGRDFMIRHGQNVQATFTDLGDRARMADVLPIARLVMNNYTEKKTDRVYLVFARFMSMSQQRPEVRQVLPVEPAHVEAQGKASRVDYIYEPDPAGVLGQLLPRFVEMQVYQAVLESIASEQSARMLAMQNATDAAKDMISSLTLVLNKARQESITKELLDLVGGVAALEG